MKIDPKHRCRECEGQGTLAVVNSSGEIVGYTDCYDCLEGLRDGYEKCPACSGKGCHVCNDAGYTEELPFGEFYRLKEQAAKYAATPKRGRT